MKPTWKQLLPACLISLILGAAVGGFGQRAVLRRFLSRGHDATRVLERMSKELSLEEDQKSAVKAILEADSVKLKALRAQTGAQFDELRKSMQAEIKKVLSAEQQAKFDAIVAKHEERRKKRREMMPR